MRLSRLKDIVVVSARSLANTTFRRFPATMSDLKRQMESRCDGHSGTFTFSVREDVTFAVPVAIDGLVHSIELMPGQDLRLTARHFVKLHQLKSAGAAERVHRYLEDATNELLGNATERALLSWSSH